MREVVRRAVVDGIRLIPQGANTGLVGASVPPADDPAVVLSLERLAGVPVIDVANATAVVEAGTRLSALNAAAAPHGLHLPVDLGADPAIGGMIGTNTGGSRVLRYGPMRSQVLGVELVTADDDASILGHLTGLRKDSRGLDAVHLAVGSGGTLGVVTRAVIALTPLPRTVETWWLALADAGAAVDVLGLLDARRPGTLSAFELVSKNALARTLSADGAPANPFGGDRPAAAVLAEWSFGDTVSPEAVAADVEAAFDAGLVTDGRQVDPAAAWGLRHRVSESLRIHGVVLGHDVSTPRSALLAVRDAAADAVAELAPRGRGVRVRPRRRRRPPPQRAVPPGRRAAVTGAGGDDPFAHRRAGDRRRRQLQRRARTRPAQRGALARHRPARRAAPDRRDQVRRRPPPHPRPPRPPLQPRDVATLVPEPPI